MKKNISIVLFLVFSFFLFAKDFQKESYDIRNNRTNYLTSQSISQMWKNSEWTDSLKYEYSHNIQNNLRQVLTSYKIENTWVDSFKTTYFYDENENILEYVVEKNVNSAWENYYKYSYFYENNLIDLCVYSLWYENDWLAISQGTYSFDGNDNIIEEFWQYWADPETLIDWTINTFTYDSENLLLTNDQQLWSSDNWIDSYRYDYSYYEFGKMEENTYQEYDGDWTNIYRYVYEYDDNENLEKIIYYLWSENWYENLYSEYVYDVNLNILEEIWKYDINSITYNYSKNLNEYIEESEKSDLAKTHEINISISNPNFENCTISFNSKIDRRISIDIYNLKGQKVKSFGEFPSSKTSQINWNLKNEDNQKVSSGIYFLSIKNRDSVEVKKFTIMK